MRFLRDRNGDSHHSSDLESGAVLGTRPVWNCSAVGGQTFCSNPPQAEILTAKGVKN